MDHLERVAPARTFLPEASTRDDRIHKLYIRQLRDLSTPTLDGRHPEQTLARGTALLEQLRRESPLTWWVGVGTALGYAREGGFIAGDTDIDARVALDFRDEAAAMAEAHRIVRSFEAAGFAVVREMYWDRRPMQTAFADTRNDGIVLDLFYFYSSYSRGHYVNVNEVGWREKPARFIDGLRRAAWPGHPEIEVYLPWPLDEYNEWRWGPEWRIPKRNEELDPALDLRCIRPLPTEWAVLTYGTFDLLHPGHLSLLERAAALGDRLVVGVVSDEVLHQKGKPVTNSEQHRAELVAALRCVDEVFIQRELDQKESDIEHFDASYLVVGDDWDGHPRFERARGHRGCELVYLPRTPGISTSSLRHRIRNATMTSGFESLGSWHATLDPDARVTVDQVPAGSSGSTVADLLATPVADKVALFEDRVDRTRYRLSFDLACQGTIVLEMDRLRVHKKVGAAGRFGVFDREVGWLRRLHGGSVTPQLLAARDGVIVSRYVGEPVRRYNLPPDWREQAEGILHHLEAAHCRHNDIKCDNLMVLDGQLYLIDFGWATHADEPIPSGWPDGIGRQHRLDVHRFDDRVAIFEALASAERGEVDRSIRLPIGAAPLS